MKLFVSPASPFGRKASITIAELGLESRVVQEAAVVTPVGRNDEVARGNPLVKIPTLLLDDGTSLYDSPVICEYLDHLSGAPRFFPEAGPARWSALRRQALADGLMDAAILLRYELALRPEALRWPEWMTGQTAKVTGALNAMEAEAAGFGTAFDIGHIAIACALGYLDLRYENMQWRNNRPALAAWFAVVSQRPSMLATTPKA
jgi:glutathione S-transferase